LIKILLKKSVMEVLNKINPIINGFSDYYAWSNSYNKLKTFDRLLFYYFKKYSIRKLKNRGLLKPILIANKFLICKTVLSPKANFTCAPLSILFRSIVSKLCTKASFYMYAFSK
jgi:hypothetical protein